MNCRKLTQKYGGGRGLALSAVQQYARQLFVACKHMHDNGIVHADLKPDNMVVSKNYRTLKVGVGVRVRVTRFALPSLLGFAVCYRPGHLQTISNDSDHSLHLSLPRLFSHCMCWSLYRARAHS